MAADWRTKLAADIGRAVQQHFPQEATADDFREAVSICLGSLVGIFNGLHGRRQADMAGEIALNAALESHKNKRGI